MQFRIIDKDPLQVLSSTKPIVENLKHITIHEGNLDAISKIISAQLGKGLDTADMHFGGTGNLENDVQLIFIEDVVNFCFWAEKDKPKWQIEWPRGMITTGGWYSLTKCFQRAIAEKVPVLETNYLINLTFKQAKSLFRGIQKTEIPLLEKRLANLQEAGKVLEKKYCGKFINALEDARFDAIEIVKLVYKDFPSFRDAVKWQGKRIYFLKRAQICAQDFSYLNEKHPQIKIKNIDMLTAFADYKIPQVLRKYGVIFYCKKLAEKADNYILIPERSREEIEIRAVTIWCIELIKQKLKKYTAADIDNALWLISQDQTDVKPYHRTYTIYY